MKAALAIALACVVALVAWLALRDTQRETTAAAPSMAASPMRESASEPMSPAPGAKSRERESSIAASESDALAGAAFSAPQAAAEPTFVTLYGFLRPAQGREELSSDAALRIVDHLGVSQKARVSSDGAYSLSGLAAGHYWITSTSARDGKASAQVELDAATSEQRLDLQLALPPEILIKVTDRADKPVHRMGLLAVATREAPGEWIEEISGSFNNPVGVGHFWQNGYANEHMPEEYLGKVILDVEPPLYVSVLAYQRVLATQRVEPGQSEVAFVLDSDAPASKTGGLRFRLVDAQTGERLDCRSAMLIGAGGGRTTTPDQDALRADDLPPGWYVISTSVAGYERVRQRARVEPDAVNDLGDLRLDREATISGVVVDDAGAGVVQEIRVDRFEGTGPSASVAVEMSDARGNFRIDGLGHARYRLRVGGAATPWARTNLVVDTRAASLENVRLQLVRGVPLVVRPSSANWRDVRFDVLDDTGALVLSSKLSFEAPQPILLAPGDYQVEVRVGDGDPKRIPVTIGADAVELPLP